MNAAGGRCEIESCAPQPMPAASTLFGVGREFDRAALDAAAAALPV